MIILYLGIVAGLIGSLISMGRAYDGNQMSGAREYHYTFIKPRALVNRHLENPFL